MKQNSSRIVKINKDRDSKYFLLSDYVIFWKMLIFLNKLSSTKMLKIHLVNSPNENVFNKQRNQNNIEVKNVWCVNSNWKHKMNKQDIIQNCYKISGKIGQGSHSHVYKAVDLKDKNNSM